MKKTRRKSAPRKNAPADNQPNTLKTVAKPASADRRALLRNGAIIGAVVLGGGYLSVTSVLATMAEHDLSRIGNGIPAVVQVHDPQCVQCRALQQQARMAMGQFDADSLLYLVADLASDEGRALASKHLVGKTTLLLFDGDGQLRQTLRGVHSNQALSAAFTGSLGVPTGG